MWSCGRKTASSRCEDGQSRFGGLSAGGVLFAAICFSASLTPSLIPRSYPVQGVLSGLSAVVGYCIAALLSWLWGYLELPRVPLAIRRRLDLALIGVAIAIAAAFAWQTTAWQNSVLRAMAQPLVTSAYPIRSTIVAIATFVPLLFLGRGFCWLFHASSGRMRHYLPRRVANVIGVATAVAVFWTLANGVVFRVGLHMLDATYREADEMIPPDGTPPASASKTGSPSSLVTWEDLGRRGRDFVSTGPTADDIRAFTGRDALEPIRVYVGLSAAGTARERAELALAELKRTGAFSRRALVVITPTGTGWIDPSAVDPLEYLFHGDVASVALQYSYLSSPLSLLFEPGYGADAARELFGTVYRYWRLLPKDSRPKLYLHGLSLGALNSERSAELYDLLAAPPDGALWSGPPFESHYWRYFTANRQPGSPAWLPEFGDGSLVRFMNQERTTVPATAPWGPMRLVYLQYASDPIIFFDYRDLYRRPAWLIGSRGPDVSPDLEWYPIVSFLQLSFDALIATGAPMGYGHVYAPQHYIDAWLLVTGISDWSEDDVARLKRWFYQKNTAASDGGHD